MATALNEVTAMPLRTVSLSAWSQASHSSPTRPGELNLAIDRIMAELIQPEIPMTIRTTSYPPWIRPTEPCSGVIWANVPNTVETWRDEEGAWTIKQVASREDHNPHYLRLSPAPTGEDRVQFGFCPIRVNKLDELRRESLWRGELRMSRLAIQVTRGCSLRVDKMIIGAIRLAQPTVRSEESTRFRELLGRRSISVFISDMLRGCYSDSASGQDVLRGRDTRYVEMMKLVVSKAYGEWNHPTDEVGLGRFRNIMGLESNGSWATSVVWPYMYNVVMPRSIFEANSRNLEAGIPPIIPHYATPKTHMFNGSWVDPCAGLTFPTTSGIRGVGQKLVAGMLARSNTDLTGSVSLWPTRDNPPQEWVDGFVRCVERVREMEMPLDVGDRADLVLQESHHIPLVFRVHQPGSPAENRTYKFVRMVGGSHTNRVVHNVTVRECSPSGDEWIGEAVQSNPTTPRTTTSPPVGEAEVVDEDNETGETPPMPEQDTCVDCEGAYPDEDFYLCHYCGERVCRDCANQCANCGGHMCGECRVTPQNGGGDICTVCSNEGVG